MARVRASANSLQDELLRAAPPPERGRQGARSATRTRSGTSCCGPRQRRRVLRGIALGGQGAARGGRTARGGAGGDPEGERPSSRGAGACLPACLPARPGACAPCRVVGDLLAASAAALQRAGATGPGRPSSRRRLARPSPGARLDLAPRRGDDLRPTARVLVRTRSDTPAPRTAPRKRGGPKSTRPRPRGASASGRPGRKPRRPRSPVPLRLRRRRLPPRGRRQGAQGRATRNHT
jgi:hypothetical protein